jgi:hypothetical protein
MERREQSSNKWLIYEQEKKKIINKNLTYQEYEKEIWALKERFY